MMPRLTYVREIGLEVFGAGGQSVAAHLVVRGLFVVAASREGEGSQKSKTNFSFHCVLHGCHHGGQRPCEIGSIGAIEDAHPVECGYPQGFGLLHDISSLVGSSLFQSIRRGTGHGDVIAVGTILADDDGDALAHVFRLRRANILVISVLQVLFHAP